jgi:hypothetical protein
VRVRVRSEAPKDLGVKSEWTMRTRARRAHMSETVASETVKSEIVRSEIVRRE